MTNALKPEAIEETPQTDETSLGKQFFRPRTLIAFLISFGIIYFFVSRMNIDLAETWQTISRVDPFRLILAAAIYYGAFPIRGFRWKLLFKNVGFDEGGGKKLPSTWTLGRFIVMSWFANCILPAKLGDAYRAYLGKRELGVSFSKTMGTVLAERVIDVVIIFLLLIAASISVIRYAETQTALNIIGVGLGLVAVMAVGLVGMARFGTTFVERLLPKRFHDLYQLFHEGTFHSFRNLPVIAVLSVVVWLTEAARVYLVASALGISLDPGLILFVALADALLVGIPLTPGGLGVVEAGLAGILMLAVSKEQAASIAILDRSISYWSVLVLGVLLHTWEVRRLSARRARLHVSD